MSREAIVVLALFINLLLMTFVLCLIHKRITIIENKILELMVWINRKLNQ